MWCTPSCTVHMRRAWKRNRKGSCHAEFVCTVLYQYMPATCKGLVRHAPCMIHTARPAARSPQTFFGEMALLILLVALPVGLIRRRLQRIRFHISDRSARSRSTAVDHPDHHHIEPKGNFLGTRVNDRQFYQGNSRRFWNETCHGGNSLSDELET